MQTKIRTLSGIALLATILVVGIPGVPALAAKRFLTIATGPLTGVSYPAGRALCHIINRRVPNTRCAAWRTAGSGANMDALMDGSADLAIVQNDVARARKAPNIVQVMRLHQDYLTVIVRADDPAATLADLPFRKLYSGSLESGHRGSAVIIAKILDRKLRKPSKSQADLISPPLCAGTVRGLMLMVGQPAGMVQEAIRSCNTRLVGLGEPMITQLTKANLVYTRVTIPAGLYRGQTQGVTTVGQASLLLARKDLPTALVKAIVAAISADLDTLRAAHPALKHLDKRQLRALDTALPVHPGAAAYYTATR